MMSRGRVRAVWGLAALLLCSAAVAGQAPVAANSENPLGLQLHRFVAVVSDVARTAQWYGDVLGFRLDLHGRADDRFDYADMSIPGFRVTFLQLRKDIRDVDIYRSRQPSRPGWVRMTLAVADPAALYAEMQKRGAKPRTRGSGPLTSFLIDDPDGNEIEIVRIGVEMR